MSHKHISWLLLFALTFPFVVIYFSLQYQIKKTKHKIKYHVIEKAPLQSLVLLKFTKKETISLLKWQHDKEFEFCEVMYDVVKEELHGDSVFYYCWQDNEETQLYRKVKRLLAFSLQQNPQRREAKNILLSFFKTLFHNSFPKYQFIPPVIPLILQDPSKKISVTGPMPEPLPPESPFTKKSYGCI